MQTELDFAKIDRQVKIPFSDLEIEAQRPDFFLDLEPIERLIPEIEKSQQEDYFNNFWSKGFNLTQQQYHKLDEKLKAIAKTACPVFADKMLPLFYDAIVAYTTLFVDNLENSEKSKDRTHSPVVSSILTG